MWGGYVDHVDVRVVGQAGIVAVGVLRAKGLGELVSAGLVARSDTKLHSIVDQSKLLGELCCDNTCAKNAPANGRSVTGCRIWHRRLPKE